MLIYSVVPPRHYTLESCWVGVSLPKGEQSHAETNWGRGFTTVPTSHVISSPRPCSHPVAPPCSPLKLLSSEWDCVPQMAGASSDAAGRRARDTCVFSLLWEEAKGLEGGSWVSEPPKLWSWPPTHGPCRHVGCRAKCANPQL